MANKEIKTRIQNKRDTAANWEAVATTFQPLDGELIIVDTAAGKTRFKVGRYDAAKGRLLYYNEIPFTDEYLYTVSSVPSTKQTFIIYNSGDGEYYLWR